MKVLFINPHEIYHREYDYFRIGNNLGIAYLSSVVKQLRHEVGFVDCAAENLTHEEEISPNLYMVGLSQDEIEKRIIDFKPDLICISCQRTPQYYSVERLVKIIRCLDKHIKIAVGGVHITGLYEYVFRHLGVDYVIRGEGEIAIMKLLEHLQGRRRLEEIPGIVFLNDGKVCVTRQNHVFNLDLLPDPDYGIFKKELYANPRFHTGVIRGRYLVDYIYSRGCPNNCTFCMASKVNGVIRRSFSVERIYNQLHYIKELGYDEVLIEDDDVLADAEFSIKVFQILHKLGFYWSILNGLNRVLLSMELIEKIAELGCNRVYYPVETINYSVIKEHKKFWRNYRNMLEPTPQFVKKFTELGVETFGGFMIGFPYETREQIMATIDYARFLREECGLGVALFFIVTPYPGTQLYQEALARNWLYMPEKWELYTFERGNMFNGVLTPWELTELRKEAMPKANGAILYNEIIDKNHRPNILKFYQQHPEYKWSKYFLKNVRKATKGIENEQEEKNKKEKAA